MREEEQDILSILSRHELALRRLYEIFADKFPKHESFWRILVADEQKHSDWLLTLRADPTVAGMLQDDISLKPQAIRSSAGYVEQLMKKAQEGGLRPVQALSIARDLENALIERLFSKLSRSESLGIRSIISNLTNETEKHRNMLTKAIEAETRNIS